MSTGKRILFIVTSHDQLGDTGRKTGYYLSELVHPYLILSPHYKITLATPNGGEAPLDPSSLEAFKDDPEFATYSKDTELHAALKKTHKLSDFVGKESDFVAIFYPGGHGPMFDLPNDKSSNAITAAAFDKGILVAAVCHGPGALINVKLANGKSIYDGRKATGFSNSEEEAVGLTKAVPFLLEDKIKALGGKYEKTPQDWAPHVVVDGHLLTGQNPASATPIAEALIKVIEG